MTVEQELRHWLDVNIPNDKNNKSRDTRAVLLHYGFGDMAYPTLEQIGEQLAIGTRERVRQVLKATFKNRAKIEAFPILESTLDQMGQIEFEQASDVRKKLVSSSKISEMTHIQGLLNLGKHFKVLSDYALVDQELNKLSRSEAEFDEKVFLGTNDAIGKLKKAYQKAKKLPGQLGLASRAYLDQEIGLEAANTVWQFMRYSDEAEFVQQEKQYWYVFESRDNILVNSSEKIFSLASRIDSEVLAQSLSNSLHRRTQRYEYPKPEIILKWVHQSRWFEVLNGRASFLGSPGNLTEIETALALFLTGKKAVKYPTLKDHLLQLGFNKPNIDKAITASPLVYVDRSAPRGNHTYTLISEVSHSRQMSEGSDSKYERFKSRLKRLLRSGGTEMPRETSTRREQAILREWLFDGKASEHCAICGNQFSVEALVAAHKKKRSICSPSEKTDPRIVFPLCLFGCDYLYESGMVRVINGAVVSRVNELQQRGDIAAAQVVNGNSVEKRWLEGDASYFN